MTHNSLAKCKRTNVSFELQLPNEKGFVPFHLAIVLCVIRMTQLQWPEKGHLGKLNSCHSQLAIVLGHCMGKL